MKRRNFLLGVGSASIGGSALLGSGAFSRIESQRDVSIQVAEDSEAYLGLDKCGDTPNSSYAHPDDKGHLAILMDDTNPTIDETDLGYGVNSDSRTWFDRVFQICNNGKEQICVYIEDDENWPIVGEEDSETYAGDRRVDFYLEDNPDHSIVGFTNAIHLPLGECVCVGLRTNTKSLSEGDELLGALDNEIRIIADTDDWCKTEEEVCADLTAEYVCTTEDGGEATGHRLQVNNLGAGATEFGFAILNSPDEKHELGGIPTRSVAGNSSTIVPGRDASFPLGGIVWWEDDCENEGLTRVSEWQGIETPIGIPDPDAFDWDTAPTSQARYDEIVDIDDIDDLEAAFDNNLSVPRNAYITEIDYSSLDPELNWFDEQEDYYCE